MNSKFCHNSWFFYNSRFEKTLILIKKFTINLLYLSVSQNSRKRKNKQTLAKTHCVMIDFKRSFRTNLRIWKSEGKLATNFVAIIIENLVSLLKILVF